MTRTTLGNGIPRRVWHLAIGFLFTMGNESVVGADDARTVKLTVGVKPAGPFVMQVKETEELKGFSIDLIQAIAERMDPPRHVEFKVHNDLAEHLDAVKNGHVDLGIGATSYTSDRARAMEFSVPFFQGGLAIVTRAPHETSSFWEMISSSEIGKALLWVGLFLTVCANVIWLTERGTENCFDDRWHIGIWQAIWWTVVTITTVGYGDIVPHKTLSRVIGMVIIVVGIVLFGVAVSALSSTLTARRLQSNIQGLNDLRNGSIAVIENSIAEATLRRKKFAVIPVNDLEAAFASVTHGEAAAAVHDVAVLRYHLPHDAPNLRIVGASFSEHSYGITFPVGSALRQEVNVVLLELMEGEPSVYEWLIEKWFGEP